jgi:hypothetical protein
MTAILTLHMTHQCSRRRRRDQWTLDPGPWSRLTRRMGAAGGGNRGKSDQIERACRRCPWPVAAGAATGSHPAACPRTAKALQRRHTKQHNTTGASCAAVADLHDRRQVGVIAELVVVGGGVLRAVGAGGDAGDVLCVIVVRPDHVVLRHGRRGSKRSAGVQASN